MPMTLFIRQLLKSTGMGPTMFDHGKGKGHPVKAKYHYAILVADRSEAGRRPAASWNLAYHLQ